MKRILLAVVLAVAGIGLTANTSWAAHGWGYGPPVHYGYGGYYPSYRSYYRPPPVYYRPYYPPPVYYRNTYRPPAYYGRGGVGIYFGF